MSPFSAKPTLALLAALALAPSAARAADKPLAPARFGAWGVDLANRDTSTKPGDDFQRYAVGHWLDTTKIPADRPSTGAFYDLFETVNDQLKALITGAPKSKSYGALYASFMDEAALERAGAAPLMRDIAAIRALPDKVALARLMGQTARGAYGASLVSADVQPDTLNPTRNVLWLGQAGIGMPDRDYYLLDQFKPQREAYRAYIARTLTTLGTPDAAATADAVLAFETALAKDSWATEKRRDVTAINNPYSSAELASFAPGLDWAALFAGLAVPVQSRMIVSENTAIKAFAALYAATPLETLKAWQSFHAANQAAPYMNKAMVDSRFDYTKILSGVTEQRPRWKRAVTLVDGALGEAVGKDYVALYFPPEAKAKMEALVANLKLAMGDRIRGNGWMGEATKKAALVKLAKMDVMVGYPEKWRDYSAMKLDPKDLYGSVKIANAFNANYAFADLGKVVNRKKWAMNPQTVNAYNGGFENKIVFPAAILLPPFFDLKADDAVNYGAIGVVIGHEISHGFDDQGRKIDDTGALRDWWSAADSERFEAEAKVFGDQYAKFEAAPGAFVNPKLTMGENIADFAGVQVALDAYARALKGKTPAVIDGLTGDQRFFLAYAQVWRGKAREDSLRQQVTTDPHSPERFRTIGPLRNVEAWYKAFTVTPEQKMYLPPASRAKIW